MITNAEQPDENVSSFGYRRNAVPGTYSHYGRECKECGCVQPFFRGIDTSAPLRCTVCGRFENGSLVSPGVDADAESVTATIKNSAPTGDELAQSENASEPARAETRTTRAASSWTAEEIIAASFNPSSESPPTLPTADRIAGIAKAAIAHYGAAAQIQKLFEEMAELQVALAHYVSGRATSAEVITEIADVALVLAQVERLFGEGEVLDECLRKALLLEQRMKVEPEVTGAASDMRWAERIKKLEAREAEAARVLRGGRRG